jgi:hypothetical protein
MYKKSLLVSLTLLLITLPAQAQIPSADEIDHRMSDGRALEAAIWGMSAVNIDLMRQEMRTTSAAATARFSVTCDHAGLELHSSALPAARRGAERQLENPRGSAGELSHE